MAKCEEGYLCDVCGQDVAEITESDLYLRYVIGLLDPEVLHTTRERHIRCNPTLAQFIVDDDFPAVTAEGAFDKRQLDPAASRSWRLWICRSSITRCRKCVRRLRSRREGNDGEDRCLVTWCLVTWW